MMWAWAFVICWALGAVLWFFRREIEGSKNFEKDIIVGLMFGAVLFAPMLIWVGRLFVGPVLLRVKEIRAK